MRIIFATYVIYLFIYCVCACRRYFAEAHYTRNTTPNSTTKTSLVLKQETARHTSTIAQDAAALVKRANWNLLFTISIGILSNFGEWVGEDQQQHYGAVRLAFWQQNMQFLVLGFLFDAEFFNLHPLAGEELTMRLLHQNAATRTLQHISNRKYSGDN